MWHLEYLYCTTTFLNFWLDSDKWVCHSFIQCHTFCWFATHFWRNATYWDDFCHTFSLKQIEKLWNFSSPTYIYGMTKSHHILKKIGWQVYMCITYTTTREVQRWIHQVQPPSPLRRITLDFAIWLCRNLAYIVDKYSTCVINKHSYPPAPDFQQAATGNWT